jgi:cysteinyl-tRNA synthetase
MAHDPDFILHNVVKLSSASINIQDMINIRTQARMNRNFEEADRIRDALRVRGIILEDRPDGTTDWRRA